jgi:hypothetical protein
MDVFCRVCGVECESRGALLRHLASAEHEELCAHTFRAITGEGGPIWHSDRTLRSLFGLRSCARTRSGPSLVRGALSGIQIGHCVPYLASGAMRAHVPGHRWCGGPYVAFR